MINRATGSTEEETNQRRGPVPLLQSHTSVTRDEYWDGPRHPEEAVGLRGNTGDSNCVCLREWKKEGEGEEGGTELGESESCGPKRSLSDTLEVVRSIGETRNQWEGATGFYLLVLPVYPPPSLPRTRDYNSEREDDTW